MVRRVEGAGKKNSAASIDSKGSSGRFCFLSRRSFVRASFRRHHLDAVDIKTSKNEEEAKEEKRRRRWDRNKEKKQTKKKADGETATHKRKTRPACLFSLSNSHHRLFDHHSKHTRAANAVRAAREKERLAARKARGGAGAGEI